MLLFLDIDGVLHPENREGGVLCRLPAFEQVLRAFPAVEVVISSSWRTEPELSTLEALRGLFSPDIGARVVGATPDLYDGFHSPPHRRQLEIETWLRDEGREYEPWLALDDCDWMFRPGCPQLVLVDGATGLDEHAAGTLRRRLAGPRA